MAAVNLVVVTEPTIEPISLDDAKAQVRRPSSYTAEDAYLTGLIAAARAAIQNVTGRSFYEQTLRWSLDDWPRDGFLELPRATPLIAVTSITYKTWDGIENTWDSAEYDVDTDSKLGRVAPKPGRYFPIVLLSPIAGIKVTYRAGQAIASPQTHIPADLRHAVKMLLGHLYQNRETVSIGTLMEGKEMPWSIEQLCAEYVIRSF